MAQRPSFWIEFGSRLGEALLPLVWRYVSKRMPPEEEAAWRQAERRGYAPRYLPEIQFELLMRQQFVLVSSTAETLQQVALGSYVRAA